MQAKGVSFNYFVLLMYILLSNKSLYIKVKDKEDIANSTKQEKCLLCKCSNGTDLNYFHNINHFEP
jgi:Ni,Fe-hydrogenase I cytochrome b subunit